MSSKVAQKAAQSSRPKKQKASTPGRPTFKQMIVEAIKHCNEPNGVSRKAIRKVIEDKYAPKNLGTFMNKNLAKMIESGQLKHPKKYPGKYLINTEKAEKKVKKTPKKTQKKKEAKKPKVEKKPKKKVSAQKKKTKSPAKKQKVKSAKKAPVKKAGPKKVKGPPSPKKAASKGKKGGRGRPKKK